jgi:tetratricopeptide (TPR) repeat protein
MTLEQLKQIVELYPEDMLGHYSLGFKYQELNEPELAKKHLLEANKLNPKHIATYLALGNVLADLADTDGAEKVYRQGLAMIPQVGAGEGQDLKPDFEEAIEELRFF